MRIELSIKVTYLPTWLAYEGLRELLQNARDAEVEHGAQKSVTYKGGQVVITNEGCQLNHRDLLLGQTTKADRGDLVGKFGEGLKLGVLALVRAGHAVRICTGGESWIPAIEPSEVFSGEPVLVFHTRKIRDNRNRVSIEIDGISKDEWETLKKCFLFLCPEVGERVETDRGALLLDDAHTGRVYVRGIFVQSDSDLSYGYDLADADLDRDRRMVDRWDLKMRLRCIWQEALAKRPDLFTKFSSLLENQKMDVEGVDEYSAGYMPKEIREQVAAEFTARHGSDAVPVQNISESSDIGHLGKRGIVVNKTLGAVLQTILGTTTSVKENLRKEAVNTYSWHDLDETEQTNLTASIDLLAASGIGVRLDMVDVTDFRDNGIQGMFKDGRVLVAKRELAGRAETLLVLVHEFAHKTSADTDGSKQHVAEIERIWCAITTHLMGKLDN